jgi:hypothetical protein
MISYYTRAPQSDPALHAERREAASVLVNQQQFVHQQYVKQQLMRREREVEEELAKDSLRKQQRELERARREAEEREYKDRKEYMEKEIERDEESEEVIPARVGEVGILEKMEDVAPAAEKPEKEMNEMIYVPPVEGGSDESAETRDGDYSELLEPFTPSMDYSERHGDKKKFPCKIGDCTKSFKGRNGLKV